MTFPHCLANRRSADAPLLRRAPGVVACLALGGCERVPSINLLGAYFPSWMLCAVIGIALTLVAHRVFVAIGVDAALAPRGIVYPAFALALGLVAWLLFFRG